MATVVINIAICIFLCYWLCLFLDVFLLSITSWGIMMLDFFLVRVFVIDLAVGIFQIILTCTLAFLLWTRMKRKIQSWGNVTICDSIIMNAFHIITNIMKLKLVCHSNMATYMPYIPVCFMAILETLTGVQPVKCQGLLVTPWPWPLIYSLVPYSLGRYVYPRAIIMMFILRDKILFLCFCGTPLLNMNIEGDMWSVAVTSSMTLSIWKLFHVTWFATYFSIIQSNISYLFILQKSNMVTENVIWWSSKAKVKLIIECRGNWPLICPISMSKAPVDPVTSTFNSQSSNLRVIELGIL